MATFPVLDANGDLVAVTANTNGRKAAANSAPVVLSDEDLQALVSLANVVAGLATALEGIDINPASLAALENITVGGTVALDSAALTALESITVGGTVALDAASLAALESVSVIDAVEGTLTNAPADIAAASSAASASNNALLRLIASLLNQAPDGNTVIGKVKVVNAVGAANSAADPLYTRSAGVTGVLYAPINTTAAGAATLVAAQANKQIRLLGFFPVMSGGDNTITLTSNASPISGPMAFKVSGGISIPTSALGVTITAVGEPLKMTVLNATAIGGMLAYELV